MLNIWLITESVVSIENDLNALNCTTLHSTLFFEHLPLFKYLSSRISVYKLPLINSNYVGYTLNKKNVCFVGTHSTTSDNWTQKLAIDRAKKSERKGGRVETTYNLMNQFVSIQVCFDIVWMKLVAKTQRAKAMKKNFAIHSHHDTLKCIPVAFRSTMEWNRNLFSPLLMFIQQNIPIPKAKKKAYTSRLSKYTNANAIYRMSSLISIKMGGRAHDALIRMSSSSEVVYSNWFPINKFDIFKTISYTWTHCMVPNWTLYSSFIWFVWAKINGRKLRKKRVINKLNTSERASTAPANNINCKYNE